MGVLSDAKGGTDTGFGATSPVESTANGLFWERGSMTAPPRLNRRIASAPGAILGEPL
jgi:hypothetical protein